MGAFISRFTRKKPVEQVPADTKLEEIEAEIADIEGWARSRSLTPGNTQDPIVISDLVSVDDGNILQWVNLVMAGGGMLGIAHVGFVRVLELAGVRFFGLGGASAGAINAALIAAVRDHPATVSWTKTKQILEKAPFADFEDDPLFTKLRKSIAATGVHVKRLLWSLFGHQSTVAEAFSTMGLHKGVKFHTWLSRVMRDEGVEKTSQLLDRMKLSANGITLYRAVEQDGSLVYQPIDMASLEPWIPSPGRKEDREQIPLRIVASEVVTQTKAVFPRDADLYYDDADRAPPADFVRASMSVPILFKPFSRKVPNSGAVHDDTWIDRNGFEGELPKKALFCDGGTLSNFPMSLFANKRVELKIEGKPVCSTLGVRFGQDRSKLPTVDNAGHYLSSVFDTSRNLADREFLFMNEQHKKWVGTVETTDSEGNDFDWLCFDMSEVTRQELMLAGMRAAKRLLKTKTRHFSRGVSLPSAATIFGDAVAVTAPGPASQAAAPSTLSDWEALKVISQLRDAAEKANNGEIHIAARTVLLQNLKLEEKYNRDVVPAMNLIKAASQQLGQQWAYGAFLPAFDERTRAELLAARRVTQTFWREVQAGYQPKPGQLQIITKDWWGDLWIGRGRQYRLLVEPLDIANFYFSDKHLKSGHYIDFRDKASGQIQSIGNSLQSEITIDTDKRPGRYLMLQQVEAEADNQDTFGLAHMVSSLGTARQLKQRVGSRTWKEFVQAGAQ